MPQNAEPTQAVHEFAMSRRRLLQWGGLGAAGIAAAPLLAACGSSSSSSTSSSAKKTLTIQLSWVQDVEYGPIFLADSNKHYADAGLDIKLISGGVDIGAIEGVVASGKADIGISTDVTSVVAAVADGNPLVLIGTLYQSQLQVFMSPPDKPITSVQDLVGKRIGAVQGAQVKLDAIFKIAGLKPDYKFIPSGTGPDVLINGDCDTQCVFLTDEVIAYQKETGKAPVIFSWTDAGLPAYELPLYVTKDTLAKNRDELKHFLAATAKGFDEDVADPEAAAKLAVDVYGKSAGLNLPNEIAKNKKYIPLLSSADTKKNGWMWMDAAYLAGPIYKGMEAAGLKTVPTDQVLDMSLLQEIKDGK